MQLVETPAEDDDSWTMIDLEETKTPRTIGRFYKCIIPSYMSFNPFDRYKNPHNTVFQPKLAQHLSL